MGHKYRSADAEKIFCCYCGVWLVYPLPYTKEHLIPLSRGGADIKKNISPCCLQCNRSRSNKPLPLFLDECLKKYNQLKWNSPEAAKSYKIKVDNILKIIKYAGSMGHKLYRNKKLYHLDNPDVAENYNSQNH